MAKKNTEMSSTALTARRGVFLLIIGVVLFTACIVRVGFLTTVRGTELKQKAEAQQLSVTSLEATRGTIYDCNMNVLAQSASVWLAYINPSKVTEEAMNSIVTGVCPILSLNPEEIKAKIEANSNKSYIKIKGEIEYLQKTELSNFIYENGLYGIVSIDPDTKRYYPNSSLASTIIGFTGNDGNGLYGIEYYYDDSLTGTNGRIVTAKDGVQSELSNSYEITYEAKQGANLVLTINSEIQTILEDALTTALSETQAKNVYGIVMRTKTGEVLAASNLPDYDCNSPYDVLYSELTEYFTEKGTESEKADPIAAARIEQWKNKSFADFYHPGSVYKVFLVSGALEEGVITPETSYNCVGTISAAGRTIKDYNPTGHGIETPCTLLVNSCNCFSVFVGQQMGVDLYYKYFQAFGFTEKTGIDVAGEGNPKPSITYHDPDISFTSSDLASASFGQSISVTPLQIATAISAIGNNGELMQPYIVGKKVDTSGNTISETEPVVKRQVVSESTADTVASYMMQVVRDGTGKNAYVSGYGVAGKTGTSEKLGTDEKKYIASFAGFAPYDDPEITVVIIIDEPQGANYSGGVIAAPVAGEVFEKTLQYLGVEPKYTDDELVALNSAAPELVGMTVSEAEKLLSSDEFTVRIIGNGDTVITQSPEAGRNIPSNGVVVLYTTADAQAEIATVPDFTGLTVAQANNLAVSRGLNIKISGTTAEEAEVVAYKQDTAAETETELGSIINVYFRTTSGVHD